MNWKSKHFIFAAPYDEISPVPSKIAGEYSIGPFAQELGLWRQWLPRERDRGPPVQVLRDRGERFYRRAACKTVAEGVGQDDFQEKKRLKLL